MGASFIVTSYQAGWLHVHCCSCMNNYYTSTCVATYIVVISSKPYSESFMHETAMQLLKMCNENQYLLMQMSKLHSCISKGKQTVACFLAGIKLHLSM